MFFQRLNGVSGVVLVAALSACGGSGGGNGVPASGRGALEQTALVRDAAAVRHLYVADANQNAILRFVLTDGIPARKPDAVIAGFSSVRGLATDAAGRIYVVDPVAQTLSIFAPAPTGTAKPLRIVPIGHRHGLGTVAVDEAGRVYVDWTRLCTTDGFSCGYSDVYAPLDAGMTYLKTLNFGGGPGGSVIRSLAFNESGTLVEELGSQGPGVYTDAFGGGTAYGLFCGAVNDSGNTWGAARALYETDLGGSQPKTPAQIVVIPDYLAGKFAHCPNFYTITALHTVPLNDPVAIATNGRYIYVTSKFNPQIGSGLVFVFDPAVPGPQTPLAIVSGFSSMVHSPVSLVVAP